MGNTYTLGLDEVFLDITEQVNEHLQSILPSLPAVGSMQTFQIDGPSHPSPRSFQYKFGSYTGFLEPEGDCQSSNLSVIPYSQLQMFVASHFAQHIRAELFQALGYTTSAGIASTKLVAKLLSDLHKPAQQSLQNPYVSPEEQQAWLDTFKVGKLNGFGSRTSWLLRNKISGEEMPPKGAYGESDKHNGPFFEEPEENEEGYSDGLLNGVPQTGSLSVGKVRQSCTAENFNAWFGTRLGVRLWELLHGIDSSPVVPTPEFPKQISVEDSYPDNRTSEILFHNLGILTKSIVRRLDLELRSGESYVRFPRTLRLTMRNGRQTGRESKSARMPVELFEVGLSFERRADLVGRAVNSLARSMVSGWSTGWRVGVINIAATELMEERPNPSIQGFIGKSRKDDSIDWEFVNELPEDIRMEVLRQYGLDQPKREDTQDELLNDGSDKDISEYMEIDEDEWDDGDGEEEDTKEKCSICGARIFLWMTEAHSRYHAQA